MDRGIQRSMQRARQEQKLREQEAKDNFNRRFSSAQSEGRASKREWNVSGEWEVSCPSMEGQWRSRGDGYRLEIGITKPTGTGLVEMYALFDFAEITGIMRFTNPQEEGRNPISDGGPSPALFLFPSASLPSARAREFTFRWRGEEPGEGVIQLDSERDVRSMTFESPNALSGVFISDLTDKVEFRGVRQGPATQEGGKAADWSVPSYAWSSRTRLLMNMLARQDGGDEYD